MKITRRIVKADVPSVAMGDIAFLLLIFFVILSRAEDDSHLRWQPANLPKVENLGNSSVSVVIDFENKVYVNGAQVGIGEVASRVEGRLAGYPSGDRKVRLKVHDNATAQYFEPVIEAISQAGGELEHVIELKQDE